METLRLIFWPLFAMFDAVKKRREQKQLAKSAPKVEETEKTTEPTATAETTVQAEPEAEPETASAEKPKPEAETEQPVAEAGEAKKTEEIPAIDKGLPIRSKIVSKGPKAARKQTATIIAALVTLIILTPIVILVVGEIKNSRDRRNERQRLEDSVRIADNQYQASIKHVKHPPSIKHVKHPLGYHKAPEDTLGYFGPPTPPLPPTLPDSDLTDRLIRHYNWYYHGKIYEATLILNPDLTKQYLKVKEGKKDNNHQQRFEPFAAKLPLDLAAVQLIDIFRQFAKRDSLNENQLAEMAIAFVQQAITYDYIKSYLTAEYMDAVHPYVTLVRKNGVCSDKTLLGIYLLNELGFGACFIGLPDAEHAALGILSDRAGLNNTNYQYVETTAALPIGIMPTFNSDPLYAYSKSLFTDKAGLGSAQFVLVRQGKPFTGPMPYRSLKNLAYNFTPDIKSGVLFKSR